MGAKGSGPNGSKELWATQSLYEGIDWGSNCGAKELNAINFSIVLSVHKAIVRDESRESQEEVAVVVVTGD